MMRYFLSSVVILVLFLMFSGCANSQIISTGSAKQEVKTFSRTYKKEVSLNYLLYLPKDYDRTDKLPLVMFLHGSGERGNDINLVKIHGLPKLIEQGHDFPFIVIAPQCPADKRWDNPSLISLIDEVVANYKVDTDRIYVTGLSMGGNGTWRLATEISDRLAAIIPICGWGDPYAVCMMGNLPVWTFHGVKDNVVPIIHTQQLVDRLKGCNGNVEFTIYPNANHDSWTETYDNPKIYEWLLSHKLSDRK